MSEPNSEPKKPSPILCKVIGSGGGDQLHGLESGLSNWLESIQSDHPDSFELVSMAQSNCTQTNGALPLRFDQLALTILYRI